METLALSGMFLCSFGRSCLASLALASLVVREVRVKGSRVSPGCRLVTRAHGKSVESRTHTVLSHVTLAREFCRKHSVRVYSRHKFINL